MRRPRFPGLYSEPGAAPIVGHGENPRARWVGGSVHSSCHCYRESKAQRVGRLLQEALPDSTSELESRASALCWSCLRLSPAPRPPCPGLLWGPDLLASSARVRSRSGRASSQSRMVSLSCPLRRRAGGHQRGDCHLPGPGSGLTHLQARSPRALAAVQSRPVALRPMLPTTVSRMYCLWGRGGSAHRRHSPRPTWVGLPSGRSCSPRDQNLSTRERRQPWGGGGGASVKRGAGCLAASTAPETGRGGAGMQHHADVKTACKA